MIHLWQSFRSFAGAPLAVEAGELAHKYRYRDRGAGAPEIFWREGQIVLFRSHSTSRHEAANVVGILPLLHIPHDRFSRRIPSIIDNRFRRNFAPFVCNWHFISAFGCSSPCGSVAVSDIAARNAFGRMDGLEPISDFGIDVLIFGFVETEAVSGNADAKRNEKRSRNRARERGSEHWRSLSAYFPDRNAGRLCAAD